MIRNLQGGRFINNKEKYYFPSSAAGSSVATAFCSTKSVMPLLTKILYHDNSFLMSLACTRSRS